MSIFDLCGGEIEEVWFMTKHYSVPAWLIHMTWSPLSQLRNYVGIFIAVAVYHVNSIRYVFGENYHGTFYYRLLFPSYMTLYAVCILSSSVDSPKSVYHNC